MNDRFTSPVSIAKQMCVLNGDTSFSHLARVMVAVGRATTDVYQEAIPSVKSEFVQIQGNLTAPIPNGGARILKVGILNNHGQIIHLYEDNRLRRHKKNFLDQRAENCEDDATDIENSIIDKPIPKEYYDPGEWYHGCPHNVGDYGELYGYRFDPASIGTWRANEVDGVIEFGTGPFVQEGRWIIVEFKDMSEGRFATIPSEAVAAIMTRAAWWLNPNQGRMQDFKREYLQYRKNMLRLDPLEYLRGIGSDKRAPYATVSGSASSTTSTTASSSTTTTIITTATLKYYNDDAAAIADGLEPGDEYLLTDISLNNYSLPGGLHKTVYGGP
jgi:hypothetical protein|nr:MAG TPA: hypothetical protein [Crassvirales sp.]